MNLGVNPKDLKKIKGIEKENNRNIQLPQIMFIFVFSCEIMYTYTSSCLKLCSWRRRNHILSTLWPYPVMTGQK